MLPTASAAGSSSAVTALIIAILAILGVVILFFAGLIVLRLTGSYRERKIAKKKEQLKPLVYDMLTEDRSFTDVAGTLRSVVPRRDYHVLEQVLLESCRFLKGGEREALTRVFDELGFAEEDMESLGRPGMVKQAEAAYHLGTMRSERAVPALTRALETSTHPEVVFSCLNALSKIGTKEALEAVVSHMASSPELETLRVAEVLLERKQEFAGYLERWLERGEPDTSRLVLLVNIVGAMKDAHAVPLLKRFLEHDDPRVRARAAFALGTIGDYTAGGVLLAAMEDSDAEVRAESAEALGTLQYEQALPLLERGLSDGDLSVKMNCAVALSRLGDEGRAVLEEALLTTGEAQREIAAEALDALGARDRG